MSIVSCAQCGKKISTEAPVCQHCGLQRGDENTDERQLVLRQRQIRDRIYHLKMTSYALMTVFLVGFGWYWWASSGFQVSSGSAPFILMGLCAMAYLLLRVLLFRAQRKQRQLKRTRI